MEKCLEYLYAAKTCIETIEVIQILLTQLNTYWILTLFTKRNIC